MNVVTMSTTSPSTAGFLKVACTEWTTRRKPSAFQSATDRPWWVKNSERPRSMNLK